MKCVHTVQVHAHASAQAHPEKRSTKWKSVMEDAVSEDSLHTLIACACSAPIGLEACLPSSWKSCCSSTLYSLSVRPACVEQLSPTLILLLKAPKIYADKDSPQSRNSCNRSRRETVSKANDGHNGDERHCMYVTGFGEKPFQKPMPSVVHAVDGFNQRRVVPFEVARFTSLLK